MLDTQRVGTSLERLLSDFMLNKQTKLPCKAPDGILSLILLGGGLIPYLQKHGGYLQQGTKTN